MRPTSGDDTRSSRTPLDVVVLDHTGELGGAELALVRLCEALRGEVRVHVILFSDGPVRERLTGAGATVEVLPLSGTVARAARGSVGRLSAANLRSGLALLPFTWRLTRRLRALGPDVVHTTSLKADLIGLLPARLAGIPLVWHVHDRISPDYLPAPLVRLVQASARVPQALIANSAATAATLPRSSTIAYPGFSRDQVGPSPSSHPAGSTSTIGLIGRLSPTKGQLEFVRAARLVLDDHPGARFRIVGTAAFGEEEYRRAVMAEARSLGVDDRIEWTGQVDDTAAELDRLAVCVHASPVPEPFGQVIVEAMVRSVPVVATEAGGVPEILREDGRALGRVVAPGDPRALAVAISDVLDDPEAAAATAAAARESALRRFPVERTAAIVASVWRDVAERAARRRLTGWRAPRRRPSP